MKKYEVRNSEGFTVYESNRLYNCKCYVQGHQLSELAINDNRPELLTELNAMSKEIATQIESEGGVNPSYEKLVDRIMNDPYNVWVDETDNADIMESFVSLQKHVLECLRAKRPVRKSIRSILSK